MMTSSSVFNIKRPADHVDHEKVDKVQSVTTNSSEESPKDVLVTTQSQTTPLSEAMIPLSEQTPKFGEWVLVFKGSCPAFGETPYRIGKLECIDSRGYKFSYIDDDNTGFALDYYYDVVSWAPLPDPQIPKEA